MNKWKKCLFLPLQCSLFEGIVADHLVAPVNSTHKMIVQVYCLKSDDWLLCDRVVFAWLYHVGSMSIGEDVYFFLVHEPDVIQSSICEGCDSVVTLF